MNRHDDTCKKIIKKKLNVPSLSVPPLIFNRSEKLCITFEFYFISLIIFSKRTSLINLYNLPILANLNTLFSPDPSNIRSSGITDTISIKNHVYKQFLAIFLWHVISYYCFSSKYDVRKLRMMSMKNMISIAQYMLVKGSVSTSTKASLQGTINVIMTNITIINMSHIILYRLLWLIIQNFCLVVDVA